MIDVDKFVASLIKHYCDAHNIDRSTCKCWLNDVLEEQGLEYKDGEIISKFIESKKEEQSNAYMSPIIRKRFLNLNKKNWKLGLDYMDFTGNEVQTAFESGWDAAIKEIKADIEWRRNESTWAEYNEALDDISSFIDSLES